MKTYLSKKFNFESAHRLDGIDPENSRIHGHSYKCIVEVSGEPDLERGWLFQMSDFHQTIKPIIRGLDHQYLNEIMDRPTTAEMLSSYIWEKIIIRGLPQGIKLESVRVCKCDICAEVRGGG